MKEDVGFVGISDPSAFYSSNLFKREDCCRIKWYLDLRERERELNASWRSFFMINSIAFKENWIQTKASPKRVIWGIYRRWNLRWELILWWWSNTEEEVEERNRGRRERGEGERKVRHSSLEIVELPSGIVYQMYCIHWRKRMYCILHFAFCITYTSFLLFFNFFISVSYIFV